MNFKQFYLTESLQKVYHALSLDSLLKILKTDSLELNPNISKTETDLGNKKYYFLSTMRNKTGSFFLGVSKTTNYPMKDAYIELDYDYLKHHMSSAPVDYWQAGRKASEEEERFWSNDDKIKHVNKFIKSIHIWIRDKIEPEQLEYFKKKMTNIWYAATDKKIPIYFYDKPVNFVAGKKPIEVDFSNDYPTERPRRDYDTKELEVIIKLMNDEKITGKEISELKNHLRYETYRRDYINTVTSELHRGRKESKDEVSRELISKFIEVMKKAKTKSVKDFIEKNVVEKMKQRKMMD